MPTPEEDAALAEAFRTRMTNLAVAAEHTSAPSVFAELAALEAIQRQADTSLGRPATPPGDTGGTIEDLVHLLGSVWLFISWRYVTRHLTTEQKELFADAVEESMRRANEENPELNLSATVDRWWRD